MAAGPVLDVVHLRAGGLGLALHHVGDRRVAQDLAERGDGTHPHLLGLVRTASAFGIELALEQLNHLQHRQLGRILHERVAALHTPLAVQHSRAAERREELLEELQRDVAAARDNRSAVLLAVLIALAYSATDEFHQTFVKDRHGTPVDVLIDSIGMMIAAVYARRRSLGPSRPSAA